MAYSDYAAGQPFITPGEGSPSGYLFDPLRNEQEQAGDLTLYRVSGSVTEGGLQAGFDFSQRVIAPLVNFLSNKLGGLPIWIYILLGLISLILLLKRRK